MSYSSAIIESPLTHAETFLKELRESVKIKESKNTAGKQLAGKVKHLFSWMGNSYFHFQRFTVRKSVQVLDFDFSKIIKSDVMNDNDDLFLKTVILDWSPYVARNQPGITMVVLGDFRCSDVKNIVKGGYTFLTGKPASGLKISPGYMVSLKDPNLYKVFRFISMSTGLDLDSDSPCGNLTLSVEYQIGKGFKTITIKDNCVTMVTNKGVTTILQKEGAVGRLTDGINLELLSEQLTLARGIQTENREVLELKGTDDISDILNQSAVSTHKKLLSLNQPPPEIQAGRNSDVGPSIANNFPGAKFGPDAFFPGAPSSSARHSFDSGAWFQFELEKMKKEMKKEMELTLRKEIEEKVRNEISVKAAAREAEKKKKIEEERKQKAEEEMLTRMAMRRGN